MLDSGLWLLAESHLYLVAGHERLVAGKKWLRPQGINSLLN